jgi:homocysteine S-methyltransferase
METIMAKYRSNLPQLADGTFLSDGGMETTLIFHEGADLPHFASFVLLSTSEGRRQLKDYYVKYLTIARERGVGFILDSATWRANPDWAEKLGYDVGALDAVNRKAIELLVELRGEFETPSTKCVISGAIGPRGDGYKAGRMTADDAERYHAVQIETFADSDADMVAAYTLTNVDEAVGIARAAKARNMPCAISFTVETDGRLITGPTIREAIEATDRATAGSPAYYMINCAHPTHFASELRSGEEWMKRILGVRANASTKSHAELDDSTTLDAGDPQDLGKRYAGLMRTLPSLKILGGCCGTDHRHVTAMCEAVLPAAA